MESGGYCSNEWASIASMCPLFPGRVETWQVSLGDGRGPLWRRDGRKSSHLDCGP